MGHKCRVGTVALVGLFSLVVAAPVLAEEVIHFTSGASMAIRSHVVDGDMIRVDLGSNGFMAFPLAMVERIERADGEVALKPSTAPNRMVPSDPSLRVEGIPTHQRDQWQSPVDNRSETPPEVEKDDKGVATVAVFPDTTNAGKAKMRSANVKGRMGAAMNSNEGRIGTTPLGTRTVVPKASSQTSKRKSFVGISQR